jgi:hypothetical protein
MNRKNFIYFFLISISLFFCILQTSCSKGCLKSAGEIDSTYTEFQKFEIVEIHNIFNVYVKQAPIYSLKIKTNSTLLQNVKVIYTDTSLVISDENTCYFARDYDLHIDLYITAPDLKQLLLFNASTFYSVDTLRYNRFIYKALDKLAFADFDIICDDHLFIELWSVSGKVDVGGKCTYLTVLNHGNSFIYGFNLLAQFAQIEQRSTGDIEISVKNKLKAGVYDIGNILYKGTPALDTITNGRGAIINSN